MKSLTESDEDIIEENQEDSDDVSDDAENEQEDTDQGKKRKNTDTKPGIFKKVKYEAITDDGDGKKAKSKNDLYKPPTVEELKELKETQTLYNNNLFRLQIEELIKATRIKNKQQNDFNEWLDRFKTIIDNLPEYSDIKLSEIKSYTKKERKHNDKIDFCHQLNKTATITIRCDQDLSLKFLKPTNIHVYGLNKIRSLPGPNLKINLNLAIPKDCFHTKDYQNNRYFVRRHYYLSYIAQFLQSQNICEKFEWNYQFNQDLLPIVEISPKDLTDTVIEITATPAEIVWKSSRFSPDINNIKANLYDLVHFDDNDDELKNCPTPFYSTLLAYNCVLTTNCRYYEQIFDDLDNVKEGIKLIHIWLTQRQLNRGYGSLNDDLLINILLYLILKKKINKHMSSYQVVRNFWNFFIEFDLNKNPISLCEDVKSEVLNSYQQVFELVLLDRSGRYNVAAFLNVDFYRKLQIESRIAFKLIDEGSLQSFHSLFISKLHPELQYDLILSIESADNFGEILATIPQQEKLQHLPDTSALIVHKIVSILKRGLNKRASLIVPHFDRLSNQIQFGISFDPDQAFNFLEMGPSVIDPNEKDFREFWTHLCSDRRFKDGSISVAVYFETKTIQDKRNIIKIILDYLINDKLKLQYKFYYNQFEEVLINKRVVAPFPIGTNEECCLKAVQISDDLGKKLRDLNMPLAITGIQGISDSYSFTEVFPPIPTIYKRTNLLIAGNNLIVGDDYIPTYLQALELVIQLEHSTKWPKTLEALRYMKQAFFLEMSKLLSTKHGILSNLRHDFLEVFYEGLVFRYYLYLPREIGMLKKETTNNGVVAYKDTPESVKMEKKLNILPKLVGALKGIQSQYPSFGPSTALIKRWLRSQLLDNHLFSNTVINLLNASLFVNESPFTIPNTPQIAFLRFLHFYSELQYDIQPVIVNFNNSIPKEQLAEIDSKMLQNRDNCPNLFIATPYDNCESLFTQTRPSKPVLRRVKQLASETLNYIHTIVANQQLIQIKQLFQPNLNGYDVVIRLKSTINPVRHQQIIGDDKDTIKLKAYKKRQQEMIPVVDFNPIQMYLKELRENYGNFANFFHDTFGGDVIGVLWSPKALEPKEFKVSHMNGRKLEDGKLILNTDGLVENFYILGKDLIETIDKK